MKERDTGVGDERGEREQTNADPDFETVDTNVLMNSNCSIVQIYYHSQLKQSLN